MTGEVTQLNEQLAGFVFLKVSTSSQIEWTMCEFFITAKFQGRGIGRQVAREIFSRYPGQWTVTAMSENLGAIKFWRKIINEVSCAPFTEVFKTAKELTKPKKPEPYAMIVFSFNAHESKS